MDKSSHGGVAGSHVTQLRSLHFRVVSLKSGKKQQVRSVSSSGPFQSIVSTWNQGETPTCGGPHAEPGLADDGPEPVVHGGAPEGHRASGRGFPGPRTFAEVLGG